MLGVSAVLADHGLRLGTHRGRVPDIDDLEAQRLQGRAGVGALVVGAGPVEDRHGDRARGLGKGLRSWCSAWRDSEELVDDLLILGAARELDVPVVAPL